MSKPEVRPPEEHNTETWHWVQVFNREVWPIRWENRSGHWINGNAVVSPVRAAELRWAYIRPTETPPSAEPA